MRAIPDSMDSEIVASIDDRIERLETSDNVRVLWAIESGSRAWGFPSPDSDYDARFFFLRRPSDYLSPWPRRDVIETPLDKIYDVNGWDVAKALRLLVKGNGTVCEWLRSPIVYRGDERFRDDFVHLAQDVIDRDLLGRHYLHLGMRWADVEHNSLKRVFYALRPAAILRWLGANPDSVVPPMDLPTILAECNPPTEVVEETQRLIAIKALTREADHGEVPAAISRFIAGSFAAAEDLYRDVERHENADSKLRCDEFFTALVERQG